MSKAKTFLIIQNPRVKFTVADPEGENRQPQAVRQQIDGGFSKTCALRPEAMPKAPRSVLKMKDDTRKHFSN